MKRPTSRKHAPKLEEFIELQDRQYDPGYWLGGNVHPVLRARRPNRYGYVLVFAGLVGVGDAVYSVRSNEWSGAILAVAFAALFFGAGWRLLRPRGENRVPARKHGA